MVIIPIASTRHPGLYTSTNLCLMPLLESMWFMKAIKHKITSLSAAKHCVFLISTLVHSIRNSWVLFCQGKVEQPVVSVAIIQNILTTETERFEVYIFIFMFHYHKTIVCTTLPPLSTSHLNIVGERKKGSLWVCSRFLVNTTSRRRFLAKVSTHLTTSPQKVPLRESKVTYHT